MNDLVELYFARQHIYLRLLHICGPWTYLFFAFLAINYCTEITVLPGQSYLFVQLAPDEAPTRYFRLGSRLWVGLVRSGTLYLHHDLFSGRSEPLPLLLPIGTVGRKSLVQAADAPRFGTLLSTFSLFPIQYFCSPYPVCRFVLRILSPSSCHPSPLHPGVSSRIHGASCPSWWVCLTFGRGFLRWQYVRMRLGHSRTW